MKAFFIMLLPTLVVSCYRTTEDRINDAIEDMERDRMIAEGEKVQAISIDSLRFRLANMAALYLNESVKQIESQKYLGASAADHGVINVPMRKIRQIEDNYLRLKQLRTGEV